MNTDEDALLCDLAETYHIFDYRSLPARMVATLSVGLRDNSRIKMKMNNARYPMETMLLAAALDRVSLLVWLNTQDGEKGINRPESVLNHLLGEVDEKDVVAFETPEDFDVAWKKLTKRGEG